MPGWGRCPYSPRPPPNPRQCHPLPRLSCGWLMTLLWITVVPATSLGLPSSLPLLSMRLCHDLLRDLLRKQTFDLFSRVKRISGEPYVPTATVKISLSQGGPITTGDHQPLTLQPPPVSPLLLRSVVHLLPCLTPLPSPQMPF